MKKKDKYGYLFIAPFFVVFIVFNIYPILLTLFYTLTNYKGYGEYQMVGLDNWGKMLTDKFFGQAILNTWKIWGPNILIQLGLALILVVIFVDLKWKIKALGFFRTIFYLPNLITLASVAMLFTAILNWKYGSLNQILVTLGLANTEINWFGKPITAQMWVSTIQAWMWFGNSFIILMAGAQGLSKDYFEAARVDGANRFQIFFGILLPLLKPILLYVFITSLIGGMQLFELPLLMSTDNGLGGPSNSLNTMILYMYNQGFRFKNFGYASTIAYGVFILTAVFSVIGYKLMYGKGGVNE